MAVYERFLPYIHIVCRYGTEERCLIEHGYRKMGYFSGFVQDNFAAATPTLWMVFPPTQRPKTLK